MIQEAHMPTDPPVDVRKYLKSRGWIYVGAGRWYDRTMGVAYTEQKALELQRERDPGEEREEYGGSDGD